VLAIALLVLLPAGANRGALAEIVVAGPADAVVVELGRFGSTHIEGPWLEGERTTLRIPLPASGELGIEPSVSIVPDGAGSASFRGWIEGGGLSEDLPRALLARSLPPLPRPDNTGAGAVELLVLAGAFLLAAALRRRTWVVVVIGIVAVGGVICAGIVFGPRPRCGTFPAPTRVFEGQARAGGRWLQVDVGLGALIVSPSTGFELTCAPEGILLRWIAFADPGRSWAVASFPRNVGARLACRREFVHEAPTRAENRWGELRDVWVRSPGGAWSWHGTWPAGEALGPEVPSDGAPIGWLASGLPQGVSVLLAEGGSPGAGLPGARVYLRLVGLE